MSTAVQRLLDIMARLRDRERGCPWDVEQTFATIAPYTIEEAYEVADAIERGDLDGLREELGDLLLQVVFHARMAEEQQAFAFTDVVAAICEKMIRRHPHIFGDARVNGAEAQRVAWERFKADERRSRAEADAPGSGGPPRLLSGIPRSLPALVRAAKLQTRAAGVGFDWPNAQDVLLKIAEETDEVAVALADDSESALVEDEVGDLLFTCVNLARKLGLDAEHALRRANAKFERRFAAMEDMAAGAGRSLDTMTADDLEALWRRAKAKD
jgi:MazG family protein